MIRTAGNLISIRSNEYQEKVDEFNKKFKSAKESFDRSLRLEIFKAIYGIGEYATFCLSPNSREC